MPIDYAATKAKFHLPDGVIYLDGNSLGPMVRSAPARMHRAMTDEWAELLIRGWNRAGWMAQPAVLGDRIGRLIGAAPGTVVLGDTLSIKVYQALASALEMNPRRRVILSDTGNFPSDLYMAEGLCRTLGGQYRLKTVAPEEVMSAIDDTVVVWRLYVLPEAHGRGLGSRLLAEIESSAPPGTRALRLSHLEGNDRARGFYEHAGFVATGERKPSAIGGPDDLWMERPIPSSPLRAFRLGRVIGLSRTLMV